MSEIEESHGLGDIAIVGMTGRFPGARNLKEFWGNLLAGRENIHHFTDEELRGKEIDYDAIRNNPDFVRARGILEDVDLFDAGFFGFTPRDASILDPQQRIWLECAWEALEVSGHAPDKFKGAIGVFAGSYLNSYLLHNLCVDRNYIEGLVRFRSVDAFQTLISNDKDYLPMRTSYKLNLHGPSVNVQTACSTSLVAVCQACQSLLHYESDLTLAGGVCVTFPQERGYFHQEGGMLSPDGSCRPFDAKAHGTVFSSGIGVVVLRRLEDALADGDQIEAVIKGFALNNDGSNKVSFGAPSVDGQAEVIARAQALAGIHPETISYIEAHGTGTPLGDPIEIAGLTKAFRAKTRGTQFCGIGSVKSNIGHLDSAAGVAGLIKTVLALKHRKLPPNLHYQNPNPQIDFPKSPFYVVDTLREWKAGNTPRRAGVSSFGVGGTNAHVVLEEAPSSRQSSQTRPFQLLLISAKTETALDISTKRLARFLKEEPAVNLGDVAFSLQNGRTDFQHRRFLVCGDAKEGSDLLETAQGKHVVTRSVRGSDPSIVFMFPGQGAQHVHMGHDLYKHEPVFRENLDRCTEILRMHLDLDLRSLLFPSENTVDEATHYLKQTVYTQPALFAIEYALAQVWLNWGIKPEAMIGHSVGEYVAACLAGVFSLEDALQLLACRAKLMHGQPAGGMLAVRLSQEQVESYLDEEISLAVLNSPMLSVLSGPTERIDDLHAQLEERGITASRLHTSHAYHSKMMDPIVGPFADTVKHIRRHCPTIPIISSLTGSWITNEHVQDPVYWAHQLRFAVQFSPGILELQKQPGRVFLEVGPGKTLSTLVMQHPNPQAKQTVISSLSHVSERQSNTLSMLTALGHLWTIGAEIDWGNFYADEQRNRLTLPTYPFERKRFWMAPPSLLPSRSSLKTGTLSEEKSDGPVTMEPAPISDSDAHPDNHLISAESPDVTLAKRKVHILETLRTIMHELSGMEFSQSDCETSFMELGLDSLFLTQATVQFQKEFGIKVSFRQLFEDLSSLDLLADYLEEKLPSHALSDLQRKSKNTLPLHAALLDRQVQQVEHVLPISTNPDSQNRDSSEFDVDQQLRLMADQLDVMKQGLSSIQRSLTESTSSGSLGGTGRTQSKSTSHMRLTDEMVSRLQPKSDTARFGPYKPIERSKDGTLTKQQEHHLQDLIQRLTTKTKGSKDLTKMYRTILADPRSVAGFRVLWKEMVYQIASERSEGARIWDVDDNEYIDITMGFGANLLGHSPVFVKEAIAEQLQKGIGIGPQSPLAGEVATLLREITGMERISFCNTGSEAVMAALRMARTITGRTKIVYFTGDYHGMFEEVLSRAQVRRGNLCTVPAAPGITQEAVANAIVLEYGSPETLKILEGCIDEIAAILVEPIQSRHPELRPKEFLHSIRKLTEQSGTALIFDEIITGFRTHPAGIQGLFQIRADLATYGKVVGGGMPIGVVAGSAKFLDSLDGGMWQYGDASLPEVDVTFFAGTFVRHPLALASARAVLRYLKTEGPVLQQTLTQRTETFANELNLFFEAHDVPIRVQQYSSWFRFDAHPSLSYVYLLFYHMLEKGVYIREASQNCFFSTAHSEEDIKVVAQVIKDSVKELQHAGFFPPPPATPSIKVDAGSSTNATSLQGPANDSSEKSVAVSHLPVIYPVSSEDTAQLELPLTQAQQEIWLACQMGSTASCAFNESFYLQLAGLLDLEKFHEAVLTVVNRHEALHFCFSAHEMTQRRPRPGTISTDVRLYEMYEVNEGEDEEEIVCSILKREMMEPFDLVNGPLFRCTLLKVGYEAYVFIFTAHHLVYDGWSSMIVIDEIRAVYASMCQGRTHELPRPVPYSQFVAAQLESEKSQAMNDSLAYWVSRLSNSPSNLTLPTDRPRPNTRTCSGATANLNFSDDLFKRIKQSAQRQRTSLFSLTLSAFKVLLFRLSGQDDLIVGIPTAGQASLENKTLVGHCVNLLPLRSQVHCRDSFKNFLSSIKSTVLDAYDHQDCTFGRILQELELPRNSSRTPLVEVIFNLEHDGAEEPFFNLETQVRETPKHAVIFELAFNLHEDDKGLSLECFYNSALFDEETINRWIKFYTTILEGIVENPESSIAQLPLLSEEERRHLLIECNQTDYECEYKSGIPQLFESQVLRTPDSIAVVCAQQHLTYEELNRQSNQVAHYLRGQGVGPGVTVGLCVERSVEMVVALLAILKAGGTYVPLDPNYPSERLAFILGDAAVRVLLTQTSLRAQLPKLDTQTIFLDEEWHAIAREATTRLSDSVMTLDQLAYIIYTSGSTGVPKGVEIPHRALVNFLESMCGSPGLTAADRLLAVTTISFDIAGLEIYGPLVVGGQVHLVKTDAAMDGQRLIECLQRSNATVMQATPATWQLLLEAGWQGKSGLKMLCGGSSLTRELAERLLKGGGELWNMYGPTETTIWSAVQRVESGTGPVPIGRPITNTQLYVLDQWLQPVPVGVMGELYIGGAGVAVGYRGQSELTRDRFLANPFKVGTRLYKTGDLAKYRPDGTVDCLGRLDKQVKLRGYRIELGEIEAVLTRCPVVQETVVMCRDEQTGEKALVAYVVSRENVVVSELRRFLQQRLPDYMVPAAFVKLKAFPLTSNGKIHYRMLPDPQMTDFTQGTVYVAPRDTLETQLTQIWENILGKQPIGITDNFFNLGGESLMAVRTCVAIEHTLNKKIPIPQLFRTQTIEQLADVIRQDSAEEEWSWLVPIQTSGVKPPIFCILFGNTFRPHLEEFPDQPMYMFFNQGHDGLPARHLTVENLAAHYLEDMQLVQPSGPYYLAGYSFGGLVAYEMARQLRQQGHKVAFLALVDPSTPRISLSPPQSWRASLSKFLGEEHGNEHLTVHQRCEIIFSVLSRASRGLQWRTQRLISVNGFKQLICLAYFRLGRPLPLSLRQIYRDSIVAQVTKQYIPQSYDGEIVLFQSDTALESYWSKLCSKVRMVYELPVSHLEVVDGPYTKTLYGQLMQSLNEVQREERSLASQQTLDGVVR
ncbi:MAG: hypothetical protein NPIRA01_18590 [Nitrospirales bacterium]|nr:MAG: hypothetical protein NPIRA01_18590 [Nitrospirales bacterium]